MGRIGGALGNGGAMKGYKYRGDGVVPYREGMVVEAEAEEGEGKSGLYQHHYNI